MKRTATLVLVLVAAAAFLAAPCLTGEAQAKKVKHPSELKYPDIKLKTPEYEEIEFENGLTGFFLEDHEVPVVNIYMIVSTDRAPQELIGLNELAAWAIRNGGTEEWPADRINEELEFVAASVEFGGGYRKATISVNCLKKDLGLCLTILNDLLANPAFPEDKIELRRETMLENIRRENDDPRRIARREYAKVVYGDHPMAWEATEESVSAITRDDIVEYHSRFFHPNNAIIGVTGDVTKDEIVAALDKSLTGWQPATVTIEPEPEMELAFEPSVNYVEKETNQGVIMIGHLGMNRRDENRMAVRLMNFVLGGGSFTSRITQKVRTDEGLAYAAYSRYGDDAWTYGLFTASSQTKSEATARAIALILEQIEMMRDDGPTEEEFEGAKDAYLNRQVFDYESNRTVVNRLVTLRWEGRPLDSAERDFERISELTVEDLAAAAREYLHPDGLTILVVGQEDQFDQPLSNFGEVNVIELE
jgi:predicted Zn-dependent peptidase